MQTANYRGERPDGQSRRGQPSDRCWSCEPAFTKQQIAILDEVSIKASIGGSEGAEWERVSAFLSRQFTSRILSRGRALH